MTALDSRAQSVRNAPEKSPLSYLNLMLRNVGPIGPMRPASLVLLVFVAIIPTARAEVSLMAGQQSKPLNGTFNNVPVLHSNQPDDVA